MGRSIGMSKQVLVFFISLNLVDVLLEPIVPVVEIPLVRKREYEVLKNIY